MMNMNMNTSSSNMNHPTATVVILPPPEEVGNESVNEPPQPPMTMNTMNTMNDSSSGGSGSVDMMESSSLSFGTGMTTTSSVTVATSSSPWQYDEHYPACQSCHIEFTLLNRRRHHCRLCGKIFCHDCSALKALIPPSSIVLVPRGGKKGKPVSQRPQMMSNNIENDGGSSSGFSFTPEQDPDRMLTYLSGGGGGGGGLNNNNNINNNINNNNELLYGKGLEERFKLAREPLRVCTPCHIQLAPLQDDLRASNSNAMRFNHVDPTDARRLFNSPVAHTLGHEIRKAAYTLNNLLPLPKRLGSMMMIVSSSSSFGSNNPLAQSCSQEESMQYCNKESCLALSPNLGAMDGVRIPARLLEQARGIAILTVLKGGFGLAGAEFGTGLVVARTDHSHHHHLNHQGAQQQTQQQARTWSAPSAIGTCGLSWGALVGAQVSDHVFLLMTDDAVQMLFSDTGSVQLGADVGVALGPLGRAVEGNVGASTTSTSTSTSSGQHGGGGGGVAHHHHVAPIYTYSLSKGFYAGISLDGKVIRTRHAVNERFYGRQVSSREILNGEIPLPPAAQPLYEALARCHVYAASSSLHTNSTGSTNNSSFANEIRQRQAEQEQLRLLGSQQQQYFQQAQQQQPFGSYPQIQPTLSSAALPSMTTTMQQQQYNQPKLLDPAIVEQEDSVLVGEYGEMPHENMFFDNDNSLLAAATTTAVVLQNHAMTTTAISPTMATLPVPPAAAAAAYPGAAHSSAAGMSDITLDPGYSLLKINE